MFFALFAVKNPLVQPAISSHDKKTASRDAASSFKKSRAFSYAAVLKRNFIFPRFALAFALRRTL